MSPGSARLLRGLLLTLVLLLAGAITWTLRRPAPTPPAAAQAPLRDAGPRTENLVYKRFKGDRESFVLEARSQVGHEQGELRLRGVSARFSYTVHGKEDTSRIEADECVYTPNLQKAVFQGHVRVHTGDGFELETDSLIYSGDKGLARSEDALRFRRKDVSGMSKGMLYEAEQGRLELMEEVTLRIADGGQPPMEVRGGRAEAFRDQGTIAFQGGVEVVQGADTLKAGRLILSFTEEQVVTEALAVGEVEMHTGGEGSLPVTTGALGGGGARHLRCHKLNIRFRPDRSVQEASAGPDADLLLLPGKGDQPEKRRLQARFLVFLFDAQGRLEEVQGQKDSSLSIEPLTPGSATPRTMSCQSFVARLDPASGAARDIEFWKSLVFVQGKQRATAEKGTYQGADGLLMLKGEPQLVDEEKGSQLRAGAINVATRSGDIAARHDVRHVIDRKRPEGQGFLLGASGPVLVTSRFFEYEAKARSARYRENALLRSGRDEVRSGEIRLQEEADGARRLEASGGLAFLLHPREAAPAGKKPAWVEGRAREMVYDEARGRVVYKGEVVIRQGEVETRSPEATLLLAADGGVKSLTAGEPVEFRQGSRVATGSRGTYTPSTGTLELVGDKVELRDATQRVRGRSLIFHVGDDRILVDGREQVRTETVFRKEPPKF